MSRAFRLMASSATAALLGLVSTMVPFTPALAQSAGPGAVFELEPISVEGTGAGTTAAALRARLQAAPLAADVVDADDYATAPAPTLATALGFSPGVVVQQFMGGHDQPRVQIRGSGLQQNPTERGLVVLQDGLPINRADGTFIIGLAAPSQAAAIEVWRGASANRLGASVLGGAINFVSPTAETAPGTTLNIGAGSFGKFALSGTQAITGENASALLRFDIARADGQREWNGSERVILGGNVAFNWGDGATTQMFFNHADLQFDVSGPLSWADLQRDPTMINENPMAGPGNGNGGGIGPNVVRDRPSRETVQTLLGSRTTLERGAHRFDAGLSVSRTEDEFTFPIASGVRVTEGWDANLMARYAFMPEGADLPLFEATASYARGTADRDYYHNAGGNRGAQFGAHEFDASTLNLHAGGNLPLGGDFMISPSISYARATRDNTDLIGATGFEQSYDGWSPALALRWRPDPDQTVWVSLARSFDAPTSDDLLATVGGTPNSGPTMIRPTDLEAQTARTVEIGWRGQRGAIGWDLVAYHSELENEFLMLTASSGAPYTTNADRTVHDGVELGISGAFGPALRGRLAYTWQDFRFDDDATRGNNRLGGAPENLLKARLEWDAGDRLTLSGTLTWRDRIPVDNMNTAWAESVTLLDLGARWRISDTAEIVAEITNVTDRKYASATVAADAAMANSASYLPGEGRAVYLGAKLRF